MLCELLVTGTPRVVWADALVTRAPEFALPLRARVSLSQSTKHEETRVVLPIALVAVASGEGVLEVTARGVVCPKPKQLACRALQKRVRARLGVLTAEQP